jgi:hypothetical protein
VSKAPDQDLESAPAYRGPSAFIPLAFAAALLVWDFALGQAGSSTSSGVPLLLGVVFGLSSPLLVLGFLVAALVVAIRWMQGGYRPTASPAGLIAWLGALLLYVGLIAWRVVE